jgi:hypothetical protein
VNDHTLGDGPVDEEYREQMTALARGLDIYLNGQKGEAPRRNGFVLLMFPFTNKEQERGTNGRCNYISNAAREDIVVLLREQLSRFEGMPEAGGSA